MRSISISMVILTAALVLVACGATKTIKPADLATIDSVSVDSAVAVPNEPMVIGDEAGLTLLFGGAGYRALAAEAEKKHVKTFREFLTVGSIDIREIVSQQFSEQLKSHSYYGSRLSTEGGHRFMLEIPAYGMFKKGMLSPYWRADMRIDYKLVSPDARYWQRTGR